MINAVASLTRYALNCAACGSFKFVDSETRISGERCPCGKYVSANRVEGTFSEKHLCDPACTSARGPICVCACGGPNHGVAWLGVPTWRLVFQAAGSRKRSTETIVESTPALAREARKAKAEAKAEAAAKRVETRNAAYAARRAQWAAERASVPASDAQKSFVDSLLSGRELPPVAGSIDSTVLSKSEASGLIEWLLRQPVKAVVPTVNLTGTTAPVAAKVSVPNGRYALVPEGQTQAKFYRVNAPDKGKWAGYLFVSEILGGGLGGWGNERSIRNAAERNAVLASIASNVQEATKTYGRLTGHCGHCRKLLTDEVSVERGVGPVCFKALGWDKVPATV